LRRVYASLHLAFHKIRHTTILPFLRPWGKARLGLLMAKNGQRNPPLKNRNPPTAQTC
jgi:hypothetical protein